MILGRATPAVPAAVADWLAEQKLGRAVRLDRVGGGCINNGAVLVTETGVRFFLKTNSSCPADMFAREADGLQALALAESGPRIPQVYLHGPDFLLIEDLAPAPTLPQLLPGFWTPDGRPAQLHCRAIRL